MNTADVQVYNVDFGPPPGSAPAASYSAAGMAGVWNSVGLLKQEGSSEQWERMALVNAAGDATGAQLYMFGLDEKMSAGNQLPGDDGALMNDMLISHNNWWDACVWVDKLPNGLYEVLTYAMLTLQLPVHCVRVDNAAQGPTWIGSSVWPGAHALNVTYARHTVEVTNKVRVIGVHCGVPASKIISGINGIQVRRIDGS